MTAPTGARCAERCPYCHDPAERCAAPVAGEVRRPLAGPVRHYCAGHLDAVTLAPGEKMTRYRPPARSTEA